MKRAWSRAQHGEPMAWLLEHVGHTGGDCLIWPFARTKDGRGRVASPGGTRVASRVMCELAHGEPADPNDDAAHTCGNGHLGCVNPTHLLWKPHAENQKDMTLHGSSTVGEKSASAKLTKDAVIEIRSRYRSDCVTQAELAELFGVSRRAVGKVLSRETWSHV